MSTRHLNSYSAINLFYNGGWALSDDDGVPAIWKFENLEQTGLNNYRVEEGKLQLRLTGVTASTISQDFDQFAAPFDFAMPSGGLDRGVLRDLAAGYQVRGARSLPPGIPLTLAFDVERQAGDISFFVFYVANGVRKYAEKNGERLVERINLRDKRRLHFIFSDPTVDPISEVGIEMLPNEASVFSIDKVMLAPGANFEQPYTGDPFIQIFPEGCIVMTLGDTCPPGFEELGEDELSPLSSWLESEPGINARKGNYPASGTELGGDPLHTVDTPQVQDNANDRLEYESRQGRLYSEYSTSTGDPEGPFAFTDFIQNDRTDRAVSHSHDVASGKTRPASFGLLFCRRL